MGKVKIFENGNVVQNEVRLDSLRVTDFKKPYKFLKMGDNNYRPQLPNNPEIATKGAVVKQGYVELSNVNTMKAMTELITSFRSFEAISKALKSHDTTLDKTVNNIARIS